MKKFGTAITERNAMIATTIISSIRVNPLTIFLIRSPLVESEKILSPSTFLVYALYHFLGQEFAKLIKRMKEIIMFKKITILLLLLSVTTNTAQAAEPTSIEKTINSEAFTRVILSAKEGIKQFATTTATFIKNHPTASKACGIALALAGSYIALKTILKDGPKALYSIALLGAGTALLIVASTPPS